MHGGTDTGYRLTCSGCSLDREFDHLKYAELTAEIHQLRSPRHVAYVEALDPEAVAGRR